MSGEYIEAVYAQFICVHCHLLLTTIELDGRVVYQHPNTSHCANSDKRFTAPVIMLQEVA